MVDDNFEKTLDDKQYQSPTISGNLPHIPVENAKMKKTQEDLEEIKKFILSKFKTTKAISIIPPQAGKFFDEENELTEQEKAKKPLHFLVVLDDAEEKKFNEIKNEILKRIKDTKEDIWLNLVLEKDIWEIAMDSKYEMAEAIGMSFPLHDKGILGALRIAQIHKSLVLKKFEKYVYSYVIGGSLVRGEALKTSDVDTYVIIDDTDVKRMPRLELKEKLRSIIYSYIMQAGELAGVKNPLNVQVYLLTEFWEGVKDANPVFFTFLRDGVPLYDRGGFLPWKLLLKMGKIKPSIESIDMFMSMGDKTKEMVKRRLIDIVMNDIYWGVVTPSQALLMLYGLPPTNVKETVSEMKRIFVDKEKMLEKKYWVILEEILIKYYKGYEHGEIKEVSGTEIDRLLKNTEDYLKRLKELREEIDKKMQRKTFDENYENVFKMLVAIFGKKSERDLIKEYEGKIVNQGKANPKFLHTLNELVDLKKKYSGKKSDAGISKQKFEQVRKDSVYLIESLIEYSQRREMGLMEKNKVSLIHNGKQADLFLTKPIFLVNEKEIKKIEDGKLKASSMNELDESLVKHSKNEKLDKHILDLIEKEIGKFDIVF